MHRTYQVWRVTHATADYIEGPESEPRGGSCLCPALPPSRCDLGPAPQSMAWQILFTHLQYRDSTAHTPYLKPQGSNVFLNSEFSEFRKAIEKAV